MTEEESLNGNLNAKSDVYIPKIYREKLDKVLKDPNVKNIAITAPYDSGKTTLLKTYFKERESNYRRSIKSANWCIRKFNNFKVNHSFKPRMLSEIRDYEFISIPNFFENNIYSTGEDNDTSEKKDTTSTEDKNNDSTQLEVQLEKNIIEQLLYKTNVKKYPDSNLKRLRSYIFFSKLVNFICLIFIVMYLFRIFNKEVSLNWWNNLPFWNNIFFQCVSFILIIVGCWRIFSLLLHTIGHISWHVSAKSGPVELSGDTDKKDYEINLFNYYGDELQYYFQKSNIRYVIFEDLDRFNNPLIFQKLRGLNNNLNKSGIKVKFIYSLKDKIFALKKLEVSSGELRTKFFDVIIPVFPIHSYRDTRKVFIKERDKYELLSGKNVVEEKKVKIEDTDNYFKERDSELIEKEKSDLKIDDKYLAGLGLYISDTREIINIISETNFYAAELPLNLLKSNNAMNKLLAMMVYKNVMPEDFDNLSEGKTSQLATFMKNIKNVRLSWVDAKISDNNKKIKDLNKKIEELSKSLTDDLNTLMRIRLQQLIDQNNGKEVMINDKYYSSTDNISTVREFWKCCLENNLNYRTGYGYSGYAKTVNNLTENEQEVFEQALSNNDVTLNTVLDKYKKQVSQLKKENEQIQKQSYKLEAGDLLSIFLDKETESNFSEDIRVFIKEDLGFIKKYPVIKYLIKQGLISYDFTDYISPDPYNLVASDLSLIRSAINHIDIESDNYRLINVKGVMQELSLLDDTTATYSYAYSPDILTALADGTDRHSEYLLALIDRVHSKKHYEFILSALEVPDEISRTQVDRIILSGISKKWPTFYKEIFYKNNDIDLQKSMTNRLLLEFELNTYPGLSQELSKDKIFENERFENGLLVLSDEQQNAILENVSEPYLYSDISFAKHYPLLLKLIQNKWYVENSTNFAIIFAKCFGHDFLKINDMVEKYSISKQYIKENIFNYYQKNKNATYDDIIAINEFLSDDQNNEKYLVQLVKVYLETNVEFDHDKIERVVDNIGILKLIEKKKLEEDIVIGLIKQEKFIYREDIFKVIYNASYFKASLEYILKFEDLNNLSLFFKEISWALTMQYLSRSRFAVQLVKLIDDSKMEFTYSDCSNDSLYLLIQNTHSVKLIKKLLSFTDMSQDLKDALINRIFGDIIFRAQFSKSEISDFYFNDPDFIPSWQIGKNTAIPTNDHENLIEGWTNIMTKYHLNSKGSKYVMLKSLNDYFKE